MVDFRSIYDASQIDLDDDLQDDGGIDDNIVEFPNPPHKSDASRNNLEAALRLATVGIAIFPCRPNKRPLFEGWQAKSTTDRAIIEGWWRGWPSVVPAIDLGKIEDRGH